MTVTAKIRHSQFEQSATVYPMEDGKAKVVFDQPQRAVTPGQAVVLYQSNIVVGGGTILSAAKEGPRILPITASRPDLPPRETW